MQRTSLTHFVESLTISQAVSNTKPLNRYGKPPQVVDYTRQPRASYRLSLYVPFNKACLARTIYIELGKSKESKRNQRRGGGRTVRTPTRTPPDVGESIAVGWGGGDLRQFEERANTCRERSPTVFSTTSQLWRPNHGYLRVGVLDSLADRVER
jgi:hypothetical protein